MSNILEFSSHDYLTLCYCMVTTVYEPVTACHFQVCYFMCCKLIHTTVFTYSGKVGAESSKGLQHEYTRG